MNINNNYGLYNTAFGSKGNKVENKATIETLTAEVFEELSERAEKEVPENGKFTGISVSYLIPDSQNIGKCIIKYDPLNPKDSRRLYAGVNRAGSDRLVSVELLKGSKKDILNYLSKQENQKEVIENIKDLSKEVDEYYG